VPAAEVPFSAEARAPKANFEEVPAFQGEYTETQAGGLGIRGEDPLALWLAGRVALFHYLERVEDVR